MGNICDFFFNLVWSPPLPLQTQKGDRELVLLLVLVNCETVFFFGSEEPLGSMIHGEVSWS